jgi:hypothetical protein
VAEGDHFASYDPLASLLDKFAAAFSASESELQSGRIVLLRDALAHGRVLPIRRDGAVILKLLKFGRVERGTMDGERHDTVQVEFAAELTPAWFQDNETFLDGELAKVRSAGA